MQPQQRYTPVPGFGSQDMSAGMGQNRLSGLSRASGEENPFITPSHRPTSLPPVSPPAMSTRSSFLAYQNIPSEELWNEPSRLSRYQAASSQREGEYQPNPNSNYNTDYAGKEAAIGAGAGAGAGFVPSRSGTGGGGWRKHKKWWIVGGAILGVAALAGIIAGVVVSQLNKNKSGSSSNSSKGSNSNTGTTGGNGNGNANGTVVQTDPNDPSTFTKDPRLHQSFWAFAYTPQGAIPPMCGATQANVTRDIQLLSQLTTRLRLYGANCNETEMVLQAIKDTKVDMTIWPAVYIDSDESAYEVQVTAVEQALKTYGTDHVEGIIVGNEYILNAAGSSTNTSSSYLSSVSRLLTKVSDVRTREATWGLSKKLPVGTSDAGSVLSTTLSRGIDFFMANVHPYFGNQPVTTAAGWTNWFFQEFDVAVAATASNNPPCYIAETGWPTSSDDTEDANSGSGTPAGDASIANMQVFLDTFVCQANTNGTHYFYFEAFDEPWKAQYGGVEPHWGLFDSNRNLKNVTIPTC